MFSQTPSLYSRLRPKIPEYNPSLSNDCRQVSSQDSTHRLRLQHLRLQTPHLAHRHLCRPVPKPFLYPLFKRLGLLFNRLYPQVHSHSLYPDPCWKDSASQWFKSIYTSRGFTVAEKPRAPFALKISRALKQTNRENRASE